MNEARKARYNTSVIRLLSLLDAMHPDPRGTILIHGSASDTETYVEVAESLGFRFERSETKEEFRMQIDSQPHLLLIMITDNEICHIMRSSLMYICRHQDPIYVLHITKREGDVPNSDKKYVTFMHHKDIVPEDAAVAQKMWFTLELLKRANKEFISRGPMPDYLENR